MVVFQGLPSNSVPLCLTSWENLKKSAKPSENNCRPPQAWYILGSNFQTPEGTTFNCTNNSTQVCMGPSRCHTAQEGDALCLLEMNVLWCESANQSQNNTFWTLWTGPCDGAGGNRYKSIYIHSKTSPILT